MTKQYYINELIIERYHNKLVPNSGLCVKVQRIYEVPINSNEADGTNQVIINGTAQVKVEVEVDLLIFKPHPGEVILGKIKSQDNLGIQLTLGEDLVNVMVPAHALMRGSVFNPQTQTWVWKYLDPSGPGNEQALYYDLNYEIGGDMKVKIEKNNINDRADESVGLSRNFLVAQC